MCKPIKPVIACLLSVALLALDGIHTAIAADTTNLAATDNGGKIYKKVGPNGEVIYSDKPSPGSEELNVPNASGYKPVAPPAGFTPYQAPAKDANKPPPIANTVSITAPKNDQTFWSGSGELTVSVSLASALGPEQQLEYQIDGKTVFTGTDTSHTFNNIFRGTHVLTVRIKDGLGNSISSDPVTFHIHRPTIRK